MPERFKVVCTMQGAIQVLCFFIWVHLLGWEILSLYFTSHIGQLYHKDKNTEPRAITLPGYLRNRLPSFAGWNTASHPSRVTKLSTSICWGKDGKVTIARWQVILCDPMWHVFPHSGDVSMHC